MIERKFIISKTSDCRYVFAVYSEKGFAEYRLWPRTPYYEKKIRKAIRRHGIKRPPRIKWDALPHEDRIEKHEGEPEARVVGMGS